MTNMKNITIDLDIVTQADNVPNQEQLQHWINTAIESDKDYEIHLRIVDEIERV